MLIARLNGIVREGLRVFSNRLNESSGKLANLVDSSKLDQIIQTVHDPANLKIRDIQLLKIVTKGFAQPPISRSAEAREPFESLSDLLLENELGRLQELADVSA